MSTVRYTQIILCTLICPCALYGWSLFCGGELEIDPRMDMVDLSGRDNSPPVSYREYTCPETGYYVCYRGGTSEVIEHSERAVLDKLRGMYTHGSSPWRPSVELIQLSLPEDANSARHVRSLCFGDLIGNEYMHGTSYRHLHEDLFNNLRSLTHLVHLELYQFDADSPLLGELRDVTRLEYLGLPYNISDDDLLLISSMRRMKFLNMSGSCVTGAGFAVLSELPNLRTLDLRRTELVPGALASLAGCKSLETLLLSGANIMDEDIKYVVAIDTLKYLTLNDTGITDKGLETLGKAAGLKYVGLRGTPVTDTGCGWLEDHIEGLRIERQPLMSLRDFKSERCLVAAWLGDIRMQSSQVFRLRDEDDPVEALKWCLILIRQHADRGDEVSATYIEKHKWTAESLRKRLTKSQILEAENRARAYHYLQQRITFTTDVERMDGLPLYQYMYRVLEDE